MEIHQHEVVIVGAGIAGLYAALEASKFVDTAVLSKVYPTRSHSISAQGGTAAALGSLEEDHWEWHLYDTVRGADYLGDQDAQEVLVRDAVEVAYELEHMGCPFSRTERGKIAQREFGGHYSNFGKGGAIRRMCYAADRTGHAMLHTLYEQCIKHDVRFYSEFFVISLLMENNVCSGVVAWDMRNGDLQVFHAKTVMFGTGGYARAWKVNTNALSNTGDGMSLVLQAGLPLEIGARMGGDFIGSDLVRLTTGYDFLRGIIGQALGTFTPPKVSDDTNYSGVCFFSADYPRVEEFIRRKDEYACCVRAELRAVILYNCAQATCFKTTHFFVDSSHNVTVT